MKNFLLSIFLSLSALAPVRAAEACPLTAASDDTSAHLKPADTADLKPTEGSAPSTAAEPAAKDAKQKRPLPQRARVWLV